MPRANHKYIARAARERRLRRWVLAGTVLTGLLVLGIIGYGILDLLVIRPSLPVATVNGVEISTREFQGRVRLRQRELAYQYQNALQLRSMVTGDNPQFQQSVEQQIASIEANLRNPVVLGQEVINQLIQDVLIRQEAMQRGLEVSQAEIEREVQSLFGYYPQGSPTPLPTRTPDLPGTATAEALPSPTSAITPPAGPSPTASPSSGPSPTATIYTAEAFQENYQAFLDSLNEFEIRKADFNAAIEAQLYRVKLVQDFKEDIPREQVHMHLKHIRFDEEQLALEIQERLQEGEQWDALVAEFSTDSLTADQGGDLGWLLESQVRSRFGEDAVAVFELEPGVVSEPIESDAGWHLFQVVAQELQLLTDSLLQSEATQALSSWLSEAREKADITIEAEWIDRVPEPPLAASP
jgi:hypothetical protein